MRNLFFASAFIAAVTQTAFAQRSDTTSRPLENTIRFNLSAPVIFSDRYLVFGYERMVKKNQSFSISVGRFGLPYFVGGDGDSVTIQNNRTDKSFHISGDYRFYLSSENKFAAPHGLYVGPYINYNWLKRNSDWTFYSSSGALKEQVGVDLDMNFIGIGAELGYQFILWKRLSLDFVLIGPGIARYSIKPKVTSQLSVESDNKLLNTLYGRLQKSLPGFGKLFDNGEFVDDNGIKTWAFGYRYIFHVGYRF
ncbi:DUF3575 domain-containing protein [Pedobacter sp. HMF7647]|uniref:DUF3575 domain-containing protein n=1 Tax=Hufsiella arboris TaxID=2695275 RepID=A0A7K1YF75_9SPHI|nr:DUF3575 domain-containing protein [Hufsiella arboris]MXV53253.1 DUF3575 domain-containing protein [Hufsiella arboris]